MKSAPLKSHFIINLTQHAATAAQLDANVFESEALKVISGHTNFVGMPTRELIIQRAAEVVALLRVYVNSWQMSHDDMLRHQDGYGCIPSWHKDNDRHEWLSRRTPIRVMIGGAPWFMAALETALKEHFFAPVYSFSERVSVDQPQADGTVKKVAVFNHAGWIE